MIGDFIITTLSILFVARIWYLIGKADGRAEMGSTTCPTCGGDSHAFCFGRKK